MREYLKFYIDGGWVDPIEPKTLDVDNPTTEKVSGKIAIGSAADVDKAVKAARKACAQMTEVLVPDDVARLGLRVRPLEDHGRAAVAHHDPVLELLEGLGGLDDIARRVNR